MESLLKRSVSVLIAVLILFTVFSFGFSTNALSNENSYNYNLSGASKEVTAYSAYYGNQLSGLAKDLYNAMVDNYLTKDNTSYFTYELKTPFEFQAEIRDNSIVDNDALKKVKKQIRENMQNATDAFTNDNPQLFWIKNLGNEYMISASYNRTTGNWIGKIKEITVYSEEIYTGAALRTNEFNNSVDKVLNEIKIKAGKNATVEQLLKVAHDYICENAYYRESNLQKVHSAEPIFIGDGGVVCEGYAESFKIICDRLGVPCVLVRGLADTGNVSNEKHMWNYVKMEDGKWYLVDATWDDQVTNTKKTYFLTGKNENGFYEKIQDERTEVGDFSGNGFKNFSYPTLSDNGYYKFTHVWDDVYTIDQRATFETSGIMSKHCINAGCTEKTNKVVIDKIASVKLSATSYTYNGSVKTPTVTVKDSKGNVLKKDNDYTLSYSLGRKNVGTYYVSVTFKGKYSGTKNLSFKINPISATKCTAKLSATSYTYNGKVRTPSVIVKDSAGKTISSGCYTVKYATGRKNVGKYKVTVTFKGNYSGTKTLYFTITPVKTTISKLTPGKKSIKVNITKKSTQVTGYQIQYSTSKKFSLYKTATISSYKTTSKTLSSLASKKTYYVRVRTYKTVNGVKYYSAWSVYKYTKTK